MRSALLSQASSISRKFKDKKELKTQQEQLEDFTRRSGDLKVVSARAEKLNKKISILKEKGKVSVDVPGNIFYTLREETQSLSTNYQSNPSVILDVGDVFFKRWESSLETTQKVVAQAWNEYKEANITSVNTSLLSILKAFPDFAQSISVIEQRKTFLERLLNKIPESEEEWESIELANKSLIEIWNTIPFHSLPDKVGSFLKKAQRGIAALDDLTPEVKDWLVEKNLEKYFKIKISQI